MTDHPHGDQHLHGDHAPGLPDTKDVDPTDLLRAMLAISVEDAAAAREDAAEAMKRTGATER